MYVPYKLEGLNLLPLEVAQTTLGMCTIQNCPIFLFFKGPPIVTQKKKKKLGKFKNVRNVNAIKNNTYAYVKVQVNMKKKQLKQWGLPFGSFNIFLNIQNWVNKKNKAAKSSLGPLF